MKIRLFIFLIAFVPLLRAAPEASPPSAEAAAPAAHPLRGIVEGKLPERQALLVKHEAIPGVMMAMTMALRVTPEVLATAETGDHLTALLYRDEEKRWALRDVKLSPPPAPPNA